MFVVFFYEFIYEFMCVLKKIVLFMYYFVFFIFYVDWNFDKICFYYLVKVLFNIY